MMRPATCRRPWKMARLAVADGHPGHGGEPNLLQQNSIGLAAIDEKSVILEQVDRFTE